MASKFSKIKILLAFILVNTIIANPVDFHLKKFKRVLLKNALTSLIEHSLKNESIHNPQLIYARQLPKKNEYTMWEVSVVLNNYKQQLQRSQQRCDIYIKQDEFGKLTANDEPEQCRCIGNENDLNQEQEGDTGNFGATGKIVESFFGDPIVKKIFDKGSLRYISEYRNHEVLSTSMINATEQKVKGGTFYKINYKLIELSCTKQGMNRDCVEDNNSRVRHCSIEALKKYQISVKNTPVTTTCEDREPVFVIQV